MASRAYRVDVCSQDRERIKEVFVKLLSTCWAMIHHDGSSIDCVNKILKVLCFNLGGDCVVMKCRRFTLVFARRDVIAEFLRLSERTAGRLVYVELTDFLDDCCCFKPRVYVAATKSIEEAARGMAEDFIRECCGDHEDGDGGALELQRFINGEERFTIPRCPELVENKAIPACLRVAASVVEG